MLYLGTPEGFAKEPAATFEVPAFVHVVPLPDLPGVVLIGAPDAKGRTRVARIEKQDLEANARSNPRSGSR